MRLERLARALRVLGSPALWVRAGGLAGLAFVARVLAPATAWVVFLPGPAKFVLPAALGAAYTGQTFLQRFAASAIEAELVERVASAALATDPLSPEVLPNEDARTEVVQAIHHAKVAWTQLLPGAAADAMASLVFAVVLALVEPWRLVATGAALCVAMAGVLLVARARVDRAAGRVWQLQARVFEEVIDVIDGRLEIVAGGLTGAKVGEVRARARAWADAGGVMAASAAMSGRVPALTVAAIAAVGLAWTPARALAGSITLRDAALLGSSLPAFAGVGQAVLGWANVDRWLGVLVRLFESASDGPAVGAGRPARLPARIAFEGVSFCYRGSRGGEALRSVDWTWDGKGALALAGPNGSGKSTCLRLLLRLGEPSSGRIVVGGTPLGDVEPDGWRERTAFMPQRPYLPLRADVRTAIRWMVPGATDARMLEVLERVGVLDALRRAGPDPLGVRADSLSVGQRQRVAMARVLCRDADLYVLDEPDANLDRQGVALVASLIRDLARYRGVVFAAHSPELLEVSDVVVQLEEGRVVADAQQARRG